MSFLGQGRCPYNESFPQHRRLCQTNTLGRQIPLYSDGSKGGTSNVPVRHMIEKRDPLTYTSDIPFLPQGPFVGNMVVSLRTIPREFVQKVAEVCTPLDFAYGAPIHIGDPKIIGIEDFLHPPFRDGSVVREDDVFIF